MSDFMKKIYGESFSNAKNTFEKRLDEIEQKYIVWFQSRPTDLQNEEHDRLHHHYIMRWDENHTAFSITTDSDLPEHIQRECIEAFNETFNAS